MLADFLGFCERNLDRSFAQSFQDLFALWASGGARTGYFVEFGALNGRTFSNTYILEKLGWTGIVAEPHPDYAAVIPKARTCHFSPLCVFDKSGEQIPFRVVAGRPAMSGIGDTQLDDKPEFRNNFREVQVRSITLNDLLDQYKAPAEIDFISIDTEGSETRIMSAYDFGKRRVKSFCIEHNHIQREQLAEIMTAHGYQRVFPEISGHDDWWVLNSLVGSLGPVPLNLADHLSEVFDTGLVQRRAALARFRAGLA